MPRSFLVKKVKLDDFPSADLENSYSRSRTDFSARLHDKGEEGTARVGEAEGGVGLGMGRAGARAGGGPGSLRPVRNSEPAGREHPGGSEARRTVFLFWNARAILSGSAPACLPACLHGSLAAAAALTRHLWMERSRLKLELAGPRRGGGRRAYSGDPAGREAGAREGRGGARAVGGISPQWRLPCQRGLLSRARRLQGQALGCLRRAAPLGRALGRACRAPVPGGPTSQSERTMPPFGPGKPPARFCSGQGGCSTLHNRQHLAEVAAGGGGRVISFRNAAAPPPPAMPLVSCRVDLGGGAGGPCASSSAYPLQGQRLPPPTPPLRLRATLRAPGRFLAQQPQVNGLGKRSKDGAGSRSLGEHCGYWQEAPAGRAGEGCWARGLLRIPLVASTKWGALELSPESIH